MNDFFVSAKVLGAPKHLFVSNDDLAWVEEAPKDAWSLDGSLKTGQRCLDTLFALCHRAVPLEPTGAHVVAMNSILKKSVEDSVDVPWVHAMPKRDYKKHVLSVVQACRDVLACDRDAAYYENAWVPGSELLKRLQPAHVDKERLRELILSGDGNSHVLKTFLEPCVPTYDRFSTRTGRLTITEGPHILVLKREHRKLLRSSWGDRGSIVSLDFNALEVKVLLYEAGHKTETGDLYESLKRELFSDREIERDLVKGVVISELYGMGKGPLMSKLQINSQEADGLVKRVRSVFKTKQLRESIKKEFAEMGFIRNKHGRRLKIDRPQNHVFVNTYAQSTGVDVSLLGFLEALKLLPRDIVRPLFVLHDALILDCHESALRAVEDVKAVSVPGYVQKFSLKLSEV